MKLLHTVQRVPNHANEQHLAVTLVVLCIDVEKLIFDDSCRKVVKHCQGSVKRPLTSLDNEVDESEGYDQWIKNRENKQNMHNEYVIRKPVYSIPSLVNVHSRRTNDLQ